MKIQKTSKNKIIKNKDLIETDYVLFYRLSQFSCLDFKSIRLSCKDKSSRCVTKARLDDLVYNGYLRTKIIYYKPYKENITIYKLTEKSIDVLKLRHREQIIVLNSKADPHDLHQARYIIDNYLDYIDSYRHEKYLQKELQLTEYQKTIYSTLDGYIDIGHKRLYVETISSYYSKEQKTNKKNFINYLQSQNSNVRVITQYYRY